VCELFAMSSRAPADVRFSLEAFSRRGGLAGPHKDGWGIAWYVDEDVRLLKEPEPAADSACVRFIQEHPFSAAIVVSHIRKATRGARTMKNCQPFARELGGRMHVFAHNGDLDTGRLGTAPGNFRPVGDTDSERAFCVLLERLSAMWLRGGTPALDERLEIAAAFAAEIRQFGPANFIYSDGDAVFLHGHKRFHGDRREPEPPGLHVLCRRCGGRAGPVSAEGLSIALGTEQQVVLAASVPLTDEAGWRALAEGEIIVARQGRIVGGTRGVEGRVP
jgi:predicted glutamine amidotransferase